MKVKKTRIILTVVTIFVVLLGFVFYAVHLKSEQRKKDEKISQLINKRYARCLYIQGDFEYHGKLVKGKDLVFDENMLQMDVACYNKEHLDKAVSVSLLYDEYNSFCLGKDESTYQNLDYFSQVVRTKGSVYEDFEVLVKHALPDGVEISTATKEQLQAAIDCALSGEQERQ